MVALTKEKYMTNEIKLLYGENFQDIFVEIMKKKNPNFIKIANYGNIGDRKNDGYIKNTGEFFQVYGPKELTDSAAKTAIQKMESDFKELKNHCDNGEWEKIKKYNFVYNDKGFGISPELEKIRVSISSIYGIECEVLGISEIISIFNFLSEIDKDKIIGKIQEKPQNHDFEIYQKLKEIFYDTGMIYKLENFYFGQVHSWSYFELPNGEDSGDYADCLKRDIYFYFKNKEYEEYKQIFLENYSGSLNFLAFNYFTSGYNGNLCISDWLRNHHHEFSQKQEEFNKMRNDAVMAIKNLLHLYHKNEII